MISWCAMSVIKDDYIKNKPWFEKYIDRINSMLLDKYDDYSLISKQKILEVLYQVKQDTES